MATRVHGLIVHGSQQDADTAFVNRLFQELGDDAPVEVGGMVPSASSTMPGGLRRPPGRGIGAPGRRMGGTATAPVVSQPSDIPTIGGQTKEEMVREQKRETAEVLDLLSREDTLTKLPEAVEAPPLNWDGIKVRLGRLIKEEDGEALPRSAKLCLPRFFCCLEAPPIFSTYRMVLAMFLAVALGSLLSALQGEEIITMSDDQHTVWSVPANVGLNYLKLIYVPLLFTTMIVSVAKMYMAKHLCERSKAIAVHGTFMLTTILAIAAGLNGILWGYMIMIPWDKNDEITAYTSYAGLWDFQPAEDGVFNTIFGDDGIIYSIFVSNVFQAFSAGNMMALLLIAFIFGKTANFQREKIRPVIVILEAMRDTILASWPRKLTPLLVFFSILAAFVTRPEFFRRTWELVPFIVCDLIAINFITLVLLPISLLIVSQTFAVPLMVSNFVPLATAFGTASSGAAYPLAQYACRIHHVLSEEVIDFSLPLLNVINKPGSVTHVTVCVVYHAIIQNRTLSAWNVLVVCILTPIVTIGGASLPSSSLLTQVTILGAIGLDADSIYLIAPVDWMLDRFRTLLNIWADICIAKIVDKYFALSQRAYNKKLSGSTGKGRGSSVSLGVPTNTTVMSPQKEKNPFALGQKKTSAGARKKVSLFD